MKNLKFYLAGAAIVLTLILLFVVLGGDPSQQDRRYQEDMSNQKDPTMQPIEEGSEFMAVDEDPAQVLDRYKKWAQYPPNSRPLYKWQKDLIDPYEHRINPVGIIEKPASDCVMTDSGVPRCEKQPVISKDKCDMWAESAISVGQNDFKIFLKCTGPDDKALTVTDIQPKVYRKLFRKTYGTLPPVAFGDNGENGDEKAGDGIYTFVVRPTKTDWGHMFLEADMQINGRKHNQRAGWYSTPHIVAEFENGIQDNMQDGHLVISVPVQIRKAGYYQVDANLQEKQDPSRFIATAMWEGRLPQGRNVIQLQFFGKIINDSGINGPYIVRELRMRRNNLPVTPDMVKESLANNTEISGEHTEPNWEYSGLGPRYETQPYQSQNFSADVYNSEEKERRIRQLEQRVEEEG